MKNLITVFALVALVGCASFQNSAGKTLASVATTVDAAMKGWAAYVVAGGASEVQQNEIKVLYRQYQIAMFAAETAFIELSKTGDRTSWSQAEPNLVKVQTSLLGTIKTLQTNKML